MLSSRAGLNDGTFAIGLDNPRRPNANIAAVYNTDGMKRSSPVPDLEIVSWQLFEFNDNPYPDNKKVIYTSQSASIEVEGQSTLRFPPLDGWVRSPGCSL